ncbi:hypothetical protein BKA80DRAFT_274848 [Phyllosticta citrichinensis]
MHWTVPSSSDHATKSGTRFYCVHRHPLQSDTTAQPSTSIPAFIPIQRPPNILLQDQHKPPCLLRPFPASPKRSSANSRTSLRLSGAARLSRRRTSVNLPASPPTSIAVWYDLASLKNTIAIR